MAASSRHVVLTKHTGGDRRICIFDGYKYHFASKSVSPSKTRRMSRTQQHSPTQRLSWRCAHSGCHHMVYTSVDGMYVGDSKQHTDLDNHEVWSEDDIKTLHFRNELFGAHPYWIRWVETSMKQFADSLLDYEYFEANGHKNKPQSAAVKEE
eukprot:124423_1